MTIRLPQGATHSLAATSAGFGIGAHLMTEDPRIAQRLEGITDRPGI